MGSRHDYEINITIFAFLVQFTGFGVLDCALRKNFFIKEGAFSFSLQRLDFFAQQRVPSQPSKLIVGFWSLEGIFSTSEQASHILHSWKLEALVLER